MGRVLSIGRRAIRGRALLFLVRGPACVGGRVVLARSRDKEQQLCKKQIPCPTSKAVRPIAELLVRFRHDLPSTEPTVLNRLFRWRADYKPEWKERIWIRFRKAYAVFVGVVRKGYRQRSCLILRSKLKTYR